MNTLAALASREKDWNTLISKGVFDDFRNVREWSRVAAEARRNRATVHKGLVFGICVQKNSEFKDQEPVYKYRYVFQGNRVHDQDWQVAMFQDLGSSPATMEASRAADCHGCAEGNDIEQADVEQAYVQARLHGPETWVQLPIEW